MKMKKNLVTVFMCIALGCTMQAQQYDTLLGNNYPYYYYNYQCNNYNTPLRSCYGPASLYPVANPITNAEAPTHGDYWCDVYHGINAEEVAVYMQPDSATRVVGIAFVDGCYDRVRVPGQPWMHGTDSGVYRFILYDTNMNVLHSVTVNHDTILTARYLQYIYYQPSPPFSFNSYNFSYVHELYFDRGIDIAGNFYVGVNKSQTNIVPGGLCLSGLSELVPPAGSVDSLPLLPYEYRRYRTVLPVGDEIIPWEDEGCNYGSFTFLWPIIERTGDTCPEVQGLRWSRLGSGTTAFVQWDAGTNHRDWQLSYGPPGTPAGEGTVVDCPPAQCVLPGLAAGQAYDVYVRARCRFARDEWTGWSGPLEIGFGGPGEGIDGVEGVHAELTPNPAAGRVRVSCGEALRVVEVYDLQGRRMLAQEATGTTLDLDISTLAAGRYTVIVHTAEGTGAKALVVR